MKKLLQIYTFVVVFILGTFVPSFGAPLIKLAPMQVTNFPEIQTTDTKPRNDTALVTQNGVWSVVTDTHPSKDTVLAAQNGTWNVVTDTHIPQNVITDTHPRNDTALVTQNGVWVVITDTHPRSETVLAYVQNNVSDTIRIVNNIGDTVRAIVQNNVQDTVRLTDSRVAILNPTSETTFGNGVGESVGISGETFTLSVNAKNIRIYSDSDIWICIGGPVKNSMGNGSYPFYPELSDIPRERRISAGTKISVIPDNVSAKVGFLCEVE